VAAEKVSLTRCTRVATRAADVAGFRVSSEGGLTCVRLPSRRTVAQAQPGKRRAGPFNATAVCPAASLSSEPQSGVASWVKQQVAGGWGDEGVAVFAARQSHPWETAALGRRKS
jgi:hypothetical protein